MRPAVPPCRALLALALCAVVPAAPSARAAPAHATPADAAPATETMPVPVALQLPLILKILTYDRNLAGRNLGELRVAVVVAPNDGPDVRAEIAEGFRALADRTVKGMRLRTQTVEYGSPAQLDGALRAGQVTVLYVAPGNAGHLDALVRVARAQHIVTTTGVPGYVPQGIAVGIGVEQDRPQILINLAASRSGGSEFDASLLRIARIVR